LPCFAAVGAARCFATEEDRGGSSRVIYHGVSVTGGRAGDEALRPRGAVPLPGSVDVGVEVAAAEEHSGSTRRIECKREVRKRPGPGSGAEGPPGAANFPRFVASHCSAVQHGRLPRGVVCHSLQKSRRGVVTRFLLPHSHGFRGRSGLGAQKQRYRTGKVQASQRPWVLPGSGCANQQGGLPLSVFPL